MNPPLDSAENVEIANKFEELVRNINIKNHPYFFRDCRGSFNEVLNRQGMNRNYFFHQPSGHRDDSGDYLTWRPYKVRPSKIKTKQISSTNQRDVPKKLILKYLYVI